MSRTTVFKSVQLEAILTALRANVDYPIGDGFRPVIESVDPTVDDKFYDPPYAIVFLRPGGTMDGPLTDSQVDTIIPFQITAVGKTQTEALVMQDICAEYMDAAYITIPGRKIRDIDKDVASNGAQRDDDVPTPVYYSFEIYNLDTTPA